MAKKALIMSCLLFGFVSFVVLAHTGSKVNLNGGVETGLELSSKNSFTSNEFKYPTKVTLGGKLNDKYVKSEVNMSYVLEQPNKNHLKVNKAFAKLMFAGDEDNGFVLGFGKMPLGWGSGSFFREGDVFQPDAYGSLEKGKEKEVWAFSLKQNFGEGLHGSVAYCPDVEWKGKFTNAVGAMIGKIFDKKSFVKDIKCGYAFLFNKGHRAFILTDLRPWKGSELLLSLGSAFRHVTDLNINVDLVQKFLVKMFGKDRVMNLNVGGKFLPIEKKYGAVIGLEMPLSDVVSMEIANTHAWGDNNYKIGVDGELKFKLTKEISATLSEELKVPVLRNTGVESVLALKTKCKF